MENTVRQKSESNEAPNPDPIMVNKGFPHYGKNYWSNYDDDKKNTEQEGAVDDSDFGETPVKHNPNVDNPKENNDSDLSQSGSNYDDDKKNTEQEGYGEGADFGQKPLERSPNTDDDDVNDDSDYEEIEEEKEEEEENPENNTDVKKEEVFDEGMNPEDYTYDNYIQKKRNNYYPRENRTGYHSVYQL